MTDHHHATVDYGRHHANKATELLSRITPSMADEHVDRLVAIAQIHAILAVAGELDGIQRHGLPT